MPLSDMKDVLPKSKTSLNDVTVPLVSASEFVNVELTLVTGEPLNDDSITKLASVEYSTQEYRVAESDDTGGGEAPLINDNFKPTKSEVHTRMCTVIAFLESQKTAIRINIDSALQIRSP